MFYFNDTILMQFFLYKNINVNLFFGGKENGLGGATVEHPPSHSMWGVEKSNWLLEG